MLSYTKSRPSAAKADLTGIILFFLVVLFLFAVNPVFSQDTIRVTLDYSTIQAGINAASNGDIVLVEDGTYVENINYRGKAITVASHFLIDSLESHIENTIIDGSQPSDPDSGSVVTFNSGEDTNSVLYGFTITGGTGTMIEIMPSVSVPVGGGIIIYGISGGKILSNRIVNNIVPAAGGGLYSGHEDNDAFVILENNLFESNSCINGYISQGGGASIGTNARIFDNTFRNNIVTCTVNGEAWGGGFSSWGSDSVLVFGNTIINNKVQAYTGIGALGGGFIFFMNSPSFIRMIGNVIAHNEIISSCGSDGAGGSIENTAGDVLFANNLVYDNYYSGISDCHGTGLCIHDSTLVSIINNTITGNEASPLGGALCIWDPSYTSTTFVMNNILWGNSAGGSMPEIYVSAGNSPDVVYCDVEGGWTGTGNINLDPEIMDTLLTSGDTLFSILSINSLCIDAGNPDLAYNDPEDPINPGYALFPSRGTIRNDMGAYGGPGAKEWGIVTDINEEFQYSDEIPIGFQLLQNYPNPFNPSTKISWQSPVGCWQTLKVYDVLGNEVANLIDIYKSTGSYEIEFNAAYLPSGVYFYKLRAGDFISTKKMLLLK